MKKQLFFAVVLLGTLSFAQMKIKINGSPVEAGATIKGSEITSFEVAFDNPKTLDYYGISDKMFMYVDFDNGETGEEALEEFAINKQGHNTIQFFLEDTNVYYALPMKTTGEGEFKSWRTYGQQQETLPNFLKNIAKNHNTKTIKIRTGIGYREMVDYTEERYGSRILLVKETTFNIDVTDYYNSGQQELVVEKEAEVKQKAEEEKQEKKGKTGKVIKSVLGL